MSDSKPLLPRYTSDLPPASSNMRRFSTSSSAMQELEPSPVDETPPPVPTNPDEIDIEKYPGYFPPTQSSSRSTTNTLGARPSRIPHILLTIQKYSTVPPAIYLIMHYTNTAIIPATTWSLQKAENSLLLTRPYYQSFPLEPLLIFLPVATHVISGLSLRLYRRRQAAKRYGAETHAQRKQMTKALWPKLSLTSALGYMLYPMMIGHVLVNRITPQNVHGDSSNVGLRFFSYGINRHPWIANVGYAFMVSVASFHFVTGAAKYLRLSPEYVTELGDDGVQEKKKRTVITRSLAAIMAGVWVTGGLLVIGRGIGAAVPSAWEIKNWDEVYRSVPIVGAWM